MPETLGQTEGTPQIAEELASTQALESMRLMNQIALEMREIPELPSEVAQDRHALLRVEFPPAGGVLTYMEGCDHPYKGYPIGDAVEKIDLLKKVVRNGSSAFYHRLKHRKLKLLLVPWLASDAAYTLLYTLSRIIERFRIKPERYCDAMRELYRAFSVEFYGEKPLQRQTRLMLRDVVCMILEYDNAYRFRFQDIIVELDKEALRTRPGKELTRLLALMQTREQTQEIRDTWTLARYFLPLALLINRPLRRNVIGVLGSLDLEKVALSIEDQSFCKERKDYKFGFMQ